MIIMSIELFGLENIPIIDGNSDISQIIKDAIEKLQEWYNNLFFLDFQLVLFDLPLQLKQ